ncbi:hypothetical protein [Hymenobacter terricola]|uniref:hypothetical protein n=1 Tax=Hymenobacter terricola TaxID=2819236 RepID=UPI001B309CE1|nr:hypothetical protein [Hymenobacter terricola]
MPTSSASFEDLFHRVRQDYGQLWDVKLRGKTLEIITPHSTTTDKFVSVFLVAQGDDFVVSDGGFLSHGNYTETDMGESVCYNRMVEHLEDHYAIKQVMDTVGTVIYYKKTNQAERVSSLVLDVASFIVGAVNASQVPFVPATETAARRRFTGQANSYMREVFARREVKFNSQVTEDIKTKYSAILRHRTKVSLVNYVTGSDEYYFSNSISKANMGFELLEGTMVSTLIKHRVALVDDVSTGYQAGAFAGHLRVLRKTCPVVLWSQKDELHTILEGE